MSGGTRVYFCNNCPLVLELGGYTGWDDSGNVLMHVLQVACASCGTLHRFDETNGTVSALNGPVRTIRTVTARDVSGEEFESFEWVSETDWRPAGHGSIGAFPCAHCGEAGGMISLKDLLYPNGKLVDDLRWAVCPVCQSTMECVALTDSI